MSYPDIRQNSYRTPTDKSIARHSRGEDKKFNIAKKMTKGVHQLGLKDEPRHKTLSGKEVKY